MSRLPITRPIVVPPELSDSSIESSLHEPEKVIPESFAEWLAQPSQPIVDGPGPEQGIFIGLLAECKLDRVEPPMDGPRP